MATLTGTISQNLASMLCFLEEALHSRAAKDTPPSSEITEKNVRDIQVIWSSIHSMAPTWRGGENIRGHGLSIDRREFWGAFAKERIHPPLLMVKEFAQTCSGQGKIAIDLGCGNSGSTHLLLSKGWHVVAVDNSRTALSALADSTSSALEKQQLTLVENDITTFAPKEPVDLIVAADCLPYINPSQFRDTWSKIHSFLRPGGYFIGSLFQYISEMDSSIDMIKEMGAWFLWDKRMVRPLLTSTGYTVEKCCFCPKVTSEEHPIRIQFIAKKT